MTSYGKFDEYVKLAVSNSKNASEIVAISFYKILRKNGFNNDQIINVANNILDCLIQTLESYKERTAEATGVPAVGTIGTDAVHAGKESSVAADTDGWTPV